MLLESNFTVKKNKKILCVSPAGFEPATFGLEVQRAIHCATGTGVTKMKSFSVQKFEV